MQRRAAGLLLAGLFAAGCSIRLGSPQAAPTADRDGGDALRIAVDAAFTEVRAGRAVLVDVRSRESYRTRRAAGALALPLDEIEGAPAAALAALPAGQRPILYCT